MSNTNFPYAVVSVFLIVVCIALAYFMLLPQYEKMFAQEYEISALEQKVETMQTYYEEIRKSYEELENIGWDIAEQKISANFMEGPFFKYNMQTYLEGLVTRSGLYLNSVSIEGVSDTYEFKKGEQSGEDLSRFTKLSLNSDLKNVLLLMKKYPNQDILKKFENRNVYVVSLFREIS
jgi:hypothetical protein